MPLPPSECDCPSYRPRAFYLRDALEAAQDLEEAVAVGREAVAELEHMLAWARSLGLVPPKIRPVAGEKADNPRWAKAR
jgi:hypothetical protein